MQKSSDSSLSLAGVSDDENESYDGDTTYQPPRSEGSGLMCIDPSITHSETCLPAPPG